MHRCEELAVAVISIGEEGACVFRRGVGRRARRREQAEHDTEREEGDDAMSNAVCRGAQHCSSFPRLRDQGVELRAEVLSSSESTCLDERQEATNLGDVDRPDREEPSRIDAILQAGVGHR